MVVLLLIATVATAILVDYLVRGRRAELPDAVPEVARVPVRREQILAGGLRAPEGLYFHPGHTWMAVEGDGYVRVGMDDFAQRLAGDLHEFAPPEVGRTVRQGSPIWTISRDGRKVAMISPVDGVIDEVNAGVVRDPDVMHKDPYTTGWVARIKVAELGRTVKNLLHGPIVGRWLEDSVLSLQNRFNANLGTVMADGGVLSDDLGALLSEDEWISVCREQFMSDPVQ